jgi:hypothetical protein
LLAACTTAEQEATLTEILSAAAIYDPVIADGETSITDAPSDEISAGVADCDVDYDYCSTGTEFADLYYYWSDSNYVYFGNESVSGDGQYGIEAPAEVLNGITRYQGYAYAGKEESGL